MYYSNGFIPGKLAFALKTWGQKVFKPLIKELLGHLIPLSTTSASFLLHPMTSLIFFLQYYDRIVSYAEEVMCVQIQICFILGGTVFFVALLYYSVTCITLLSQINVCVYICTYIYIYMHTYMYMCHQ